MNKSMAYSITRINKTSATIRHYENGHEILFSYDTPVAVYHPENDEIIESTELYSQTTSRQVNRYRNTKTVKNEWFLIPEHFKHYLSSEYQVGQFGRLDEKI